jgi:hypothetical protein
MALFFTNVNCFTYESAARRFSRAHDAGHGRGTTGQTWIKVAAYAAVITVSTKDQLDMWRKK